VREREEKGIVEGKLENVKRICRGVILRLVLWGSYQKPHKGHKSPGSDVMRLGECGGGAYLERTPGKLPAKGKGNMQQAITWTKAFASACIAPHHRHPHFALYPHVMK